MVQMPSVAAYFLFALLLTFQLLFCFSSDAVLFVPCRPSFRSRNSRAAAGISHIPNRFPFLKPKRQENEIPKVNTTLPSPTEQTPPSHEVLQTASRTATTEGNAQPKPDNKFPLSQHPAIKPLETSAKSQVGFGVATHVTEKFVSFAEQFVGRTGTGVAERTAQRSTKRVAEGAGKKILNQAGKKGSHKVVARTSQEYGSRLATRSGERFIERFGRGAKANALGRINGVGETLSAKFARKGFTKTSGRLSKRAGERILEQASKTGGATAVSRAASKAGGRVIDKASRRGVAGAVSKVSRGTGKHMVEQVAKRRGPQLVSGAAERATGRAVKGIGARVVQKTKIRSGMKVAARASERIGERALEGAGDLFVDHATRGSPENIIGQAGSRLVESHSERLVKRVSKGLIITLPVLGGLFALHMLKSDIERIQAEWSDRARLSLGAFALAGAADLVDAVLHFWMAYSLFVHMTRGQLVAAERVSMVCAVVSTSCAVLGEIISFRRTRRKETLV